MSEGNNDIAKRLDKLENRVLAIETKMMAPDLDIQTTGKNKSLREFLNEQSLKSANDRALAIAYFLETNKGYESFNADDIKDGFRQARIPSPKNPNDIINKNIAKGLMMDSESSKDGKKAWVLTASGEKLMKSSFEKAK